MDLNHHTDQLTKTFNSFDLEGYSAVMNDFADRYCGLPMEERSKYYHAYINGWYNWSYLAARHQDNAKAVYYMGKAVSVGFADFNRIRQDQVFDDLLAGDNDFIYLMASQQEAKDYMGILKVHGHYQDTAVSEIPLSVFYGSNADHPALSESLGLEKIAGTGNEISKVLNIMHWLHNLIRHDGQKGDPETMNVLEKIRFCMENNCGLNCRDLSLIFHHCLQSLDIRSGYITCKPRNLLKTDNDCHVVNQVFIAEMNKWVMIDVTLNAYVMDEEGQLLDIAAVRARLISGQPLLLNPDANWNNCYSMTKKEYLYKYMAKNMYRFVLPVSSLSEKGTLAYLHLLPHHPGEAVLADYQETGADNYMTCNPDFFWNII